MSDDRSRHATRISLIAYSQEDQYLLKRSIVAAERARIDIEEQRDDTLAGNRAASVTERDTIDENIQPAEMTTTVAIPLQIRRPPSLGNDASQGLPQCVFVYLHPGSFYRIQLTRYG